MLYCFIKHYVNILGKKPHKKLFYSFISIVEERFKLKLLPFVIYLPPIICKVLMFLGRRGLTCNLSGVYGCVLKEPASETWLQSETYPPYDSMVNCNCLICQADNATRKSFRFDIILLPTTCKYFGIPKVTIHHL